MYWSVSKVQKTGALFMICLSWVTAFDEAEDKKSLNLKIGFDVTRENNGAPSLRIQNFEEVPQFGGGKIKAEKKRKRAESYSESDEASGIDKVASEVMEVRGSDGSEDADSSGSDDDRRLSTKGISPDEFEPERSPDFHGRNDEGSSED